MTTAVATRGPTSFAPQTLSEAMEFSKIIANSNFVPQEYRGKPGDILVAIQMGAEVGLSPMAALQSISVINGKPSVWGDGAIALVQASGLMLDHEEGVDGEGDDRVGWCRMVRKGRVSEYRKTFSVRQARDAGLWGRNVWKSYPEVMLVARARSACMRAAFPDVLKGIIPREEAVDYPPENEQVEGVEPPTSDLPWATRSSAKAAAPQIEAKLEPEPRGTPPDQLEATLRASLESLGASPKSSSVPADEGLSLPTATDSVSVDGDAPTPPLARLSGEDGAPTPPSLLDWVTGDVSPAPDPEPVLINDKDRKWLHACRSEGGHSVPEAKAWLAREYGVESTAAIQRDWLPTICARLKDTEPLS